MLDKNVLDKIRGILKELPVEGPCLDYKEDYVGYSNKYKKSEFIKDLCGFLNSIDGYKKDKFVIIGVTDDLKLIGINQDNVIKDTDFQDLAEFISPRPSVITGTLLFEDGNTYGYIYIPGLLNTNLVYTINRDYPNVAVQNPDYSKYKIVRESTSYIRSGSKNRFIQEFDRRNIYKLRYENLNSSISTISVDTSNTSFLRKIALLGSWDDHNDNDRKLVSKYLKLDYQKINDNLKNIMIRTPDAVTYEKGIWKINNSIDIIQKYAKYYLSDDINEFYNYTVEINREYNPKYDLNKGLRQFANIYGKTYKYSNSLRISTMKTLVLLKANESNMINCKSNIRSFEYTIIKDIIDINNWKSIISASDLLIYFAELSPKCYLDFVNNLLAKEEVVKELVNESEDGFFRQDYLSEIVSGLLLTIQIDIYFIESCILLIRLSVYNNKIIDKISMVFLPWHPQTTASSARRIVGLKNMFNENYNMTRLLTKKLLPGETTLSYDLPKFLYMFNLEYKEISLDEYYENQFDILKLACEKYKNTKENIIELLELTPHLNREMFQYMLMKVKTMLKNIKSNKFDVWEWLYTYIIRFNKYHLDNATIVEKESIEDLKKLLLDISDSSFEILHYFVKNERDLLDEFKGEDEKLLEKRKLMLNDLYSLNGLPGILELSKSVENSFALGFSLGSLGIISEAEKDKLRDLLESKNNHLINLASGFFKNQIELGLIDVNRECIGLSNFAKTNLLLQCKSNLKTWKIVEKQLTNKKKYWKSCCVSYLDNTEDINYACSMKIKYKEYGETLNILYSAIFNKVEFDMDYAYYSLKGYLEIYPLNIVSNYSIQTIIKYLQEKAYDAKKLFEIEWAYLNIFDDDCRPLNIEKEIAKDPNTFINLLCLAYKGAREKKTKLNEKEILISTNAYSIINKCKIVPGTLDGKFDKLKFENWISKVLKLAKQRDRTRVAKNVIGKILIYSPEGKDLWINYDIASFINKSENQDVRNGYNINAFNTIGVITCDGTGSVYDNYAKTYEIKAEQLENRQLNNFAKSLRSLAESFKIHAENERDNF